MNEASQQSLGGDAHRSLDAARRDVEADDPDNAVVRAYYACFHAATALLHERGAESKSHRGTHHLFYEKFVADGPFDREMNKILSGLSDLRQNAEYKHGVTYDLDEARDATKKARLFVDAVEEHLQKRSS